MLHFHILSTLIYLDPFCTVRLFANSNWQVSKCIILILSQKPLKWFIFFPAKLFHFCLNIENHRRIIAFFSSMFKLIQNFYIGLIGTILFQQIIKHHNLKKIGQSMYLFLPYKDVPCKMRSEVRAFRFSSF